MKRKMEMKKKEKKTPSKNHTKSMIVWVFPFKLKKKDIKKENRT